MRILFNIERLINPSQEEKAALERIVKTRLLKKHEHFLNEGDLCETIAFIEKGSVRYYYQLEDRQVCKDFLLENGLVCSFGSLFSQEPSTTYIQALEDTELAEINYEDIQELCKSYPIWNKLARIIIQEQVIRAEKREGAFLKDLPETRFQSLVAEHPTIFKRVPLQYIASYLGMTRETLSRYRNKLNK
ncbi:Crp/Fnr family transcriptional regulator [Mucilaginibacter corticis]|uniref:Crp/Fnr family transcriptional regulator n=1 Tax=Mucilaginibacter corticis TaxID=2597670 RepID=A0A556M4W1_9SPHI|nr:Crp/Fnr family transcriptional regulator [Mucilaginibacter corticis]TSJ34908.1 Crp/Fnr family transcriptional regulator [Mucilaginibacter corticis]